MGCRAFRAHGVLGLGQPGQGRLAFAAGPGLVPLVQGDLRRQGRDGPPGVREVPLQPLDQGRRVGRRLCGGLGPGHGVAVGVGRVPECEPRLPVVLDGDRVVLVGLPAGGGAEVQQARGVREGVGGVVQPYGLGVEGVPRGGEIRVGREEGAVGGELPAADALRVAGHQLQRAVAQHGRAGGGVEGLAEPDAVRVGAEGDPDLDAVIAGRDRGVEAFGQRVGFRGGPVGDERGQVVDVGRGLGRGDETVPEQVAFLHAERDGAGDVAGALRSVHEEVGVGVDDVTPRPARPVGGR